MDNCDILNSWFSADSKETEKEIRNIVKNDLLTSGKYEIWRNMLGAQNSKRISLMFGTDFLEKYNIYLGADLYLNTLERRCCKQMFDANRQKSSRFKSRLRYILSNYDCVFLTLTFTDKVLANTSHETRRKYIRRFLKSLNCDFYIANIDYGDKDKNPESHEREHYHAIASVGYVDLSQYTYGFIWSERVRDSTNPLALAKYINKLTSHAYKDSTKGRDRLIYSRNSLMLF